MEKDYKNVETKRDAHPKCLGLLKANFRILDNIPEELKIGVFQKSKTYKCWIRTSSASEKIQADIKKDFRGFAIKLLGITGERFNSNELNTQDFVLLSNSTMPIGNVKLFHEATYYLMVWHPILFVLKFIFSGKWKIIKALNNGKLQITSPLDINYWSPTPYHLDDIKVKYKIVPTSKTKSEFPKFLTDDFLTENMANHLNKDNATFDFYIQQFKDELKTPTENAGKEWL